MLRFASSSGTPVAGVEAACCLAVLLPGRQAQPAELIFALRGRRDQHQLHGVSVAWHRDKAPMQVYFCMNAG